MSDELMRNLFQQIGCYSVDVATTGELAPTEGLIAAANHIEAELTRLRERSKLYEQLREVIDGGSESITHDDAVAELTSLRADLERARMRLAACGVVALADTPDSAVEARKMHDDYRSASCDDVARRVDECIRLRAEVETLTDKAEVRKLALDAQTSELCQLEAEIKALRADAERYRYLRSRQAIEVLTGRGPSAGVWCDMENEMGTLVLVTGDDLDAEVDAARAALKEPTK